MNGFARGCGFTLVFGGALLILINAILTPLMPMQEGEAILRTSGIYLLRLSASGVAALLLLFGCLGLHLVQRGASGLFGTIAFVVAFVGNVLLVAVEWTNVFVLRAVAQTSPEALDALGETSLMKIGFSSAAGLFGLGWLLFSISLWRARIFPRWAAITMLAGLLLIPALGATPLGIAGAIVGNAIFGLGLIGSGRALARID